MSVAPKVSVLIPTYNNAQFLDEAIQSVLAQTYTDYELIILDNCSTDNTDEVIRPYLKDKRISYYKNETNIGLVGNWNKILDYANGAYLKYLCSDDKFHPQLLEKFVPIMDQYPSVSLVTSNKDYFGSQNKKITLPFVGLTNGKEVIYETLRTIDFIGDPTCVMLRKSNLHLGGFKKDMLWFVDWEMWIKHLSIGDAYFIPETLLYTRKHAGQVTNAVVKKNFSYRFDEYHFYKFIKEKNVYNLDLSKVDMDGLIKKKAKSCTKEVVFKVLPKLYKADLRTPFQRALKIAVKEKVFFSSFIEILQGLKRGSVT
jgi:glycosyltransferase involved in cell wall biosynthesis